MKLPKTDEFDDFIKRLRKSVDDLEGKGRAVLLRDEHSAQPDGFRPAVLLDTDRVSGFTTTYDDEGRPVPAVADSVGEAAIADPVNDFVRSKREAMVRDMIRGFDLIASAVDSAVQVLKLEDDTKGRQSSLTPCSNPNCEVEVTGLEHDRLKEGLCPKCYQHKWRQIRAGATDPLLWPHKRASVDLADMDEAG